MSTFDDIERTESEWELLDEGQDSITLCVVEVGDDGWGVWIEHPKREHGCVILSAGEETRDAAVSMAVAILEAAVEALQGPPQGRGAH